MRQRSQRQPAVRAHQKITSLGIVRPTQVAMHRRDDKETIESVLTEVETNVFHGTTELSTTVITTKVTVDSSSATQSATPSSKSSASSTDRSSSSASSTASSLTLSSAKSSSSSGTSSTTAHSSTNTLSLSSHTLSSSGQAASSSSSFQSVTFSHSSTTSSNIGATPSSSSSSDSSLAATKSKTLSTGAIIGIAAGGGALVIFLLIFLIRKRCLRRKERRINDWLTPDLPNPSLEKANADLSSESVSPFAEDPVVSRNASKASSGQMTRRDLAEAPMHQYMPPSQAINSYPTQRMASSGPSARPTSYQQQPLPQQYRTAPPPQAYNPPAPPHSYSSPRPPQAYNVQPPSMGYNNNYAAPAPPPAAIPAALTPASQSPANSTSFALVRNAFLPSLPDELAVSAGEMVRVLAEYDDGWALCANLRGKQGVVPQECLQRQRAMAPPANMRSRDDRLAFVSPNANTQSWGGDQGMAQRDGGPSAVQGQTRYR